MTDYIINTVLSSSFASSTDVQGAQFMLIASVVAW